jgi:Spy/CpxP family protein refolding chaperone
MRRDGRRGEHALGRALFRGIELSEQQRTQLRAIGEKYQAERVALRERARDARTGGARPDSAQRAAFRQSHVALMQRQRADLRGILTAEQRATFDANVQELEKRMAERRAKGEGRGHGERPRRGAGAGSTSGS